MAEPITLKESVGSTVGGTVGASTAAPAQISESVKVADGGDSVTLSSSISAGSNFAPADPEAAVKSFFDEFKDRRDQRLEQIRNPPGQEQTASLCWGKAPQLQQSTTDPTKRGISESVTVRDPTDDEPTEEETREILFREDRRKTKKIKVASSTDASVYVMVERVETWWANGSDGNRYRFEFKNN